MTRPTRLLLGVVLLSGVSAAALPVLAAGQSTQTIDATPVAWRGPGFDGPGGPDWRDGREGGRWHRPGFDGRGPGMGARMMAQALLDQFDTNKDGSISKDEIEAVAADQIKKYDKDGDGALSLAEYQQLWLDQTHERMVRSFQALDRDGDGKVTEAELALRGDRILAFLDRDNGGVMGPGNMAGPQQNPPNGPDGRAGGPWHRPGFDGRGPGMRARMMEQAFLDKFDTNKDGSITKDEIAAVSADQIKKYDKDGDGALSLVEYQQLWLDQMRERMVRSFQALDRDGDGKVTQAELAFRGERILALLDRNNDGIIDPSELAGPQHHRPDGRGPGGPGMEGPDSPGSQGQDTPPPPPPAPPAQ